MIDHLEERITALKNIESQMKLGKRMNEDGWIFVVRDAITAMEELLQRENNPGKLLPPDFPHSAAIELLCSRDYKERAKGEYLFVKDEYEKPRGLPTAKTVSPTRMSLLSPRVAALSPSASIFNTAMSLSSPS